MLLCTPIFSNFEPVKIALGRAKRHRILLSIDRDFDPAENVNLLSQTRQIIPRETSLFQRRILSYQHEGVRS